MTQRAAVARILRSIGAILGGIVTNIVPAIATDFAMQFLEIFPPLTEPDRFTTAQLLLATAYRAIYGICGGYVTARLAPGHLMRHVFVLGALGLIACIAGAVAMRG